MKQTLLLLIITLIGFGNETKAQTTLTLQPNGATGKDAYLNDFAPTTNYGSHNDINGMAWTNGGTPCVARGVFQFDLSTIAPGSVVLSSYLTLYNNPTSTNNSGDHSTASGSNECLIQKVISSWTENTVTWNTQPSVTTVDQVVIPMTTTTNQDVVVDVTTLVQDMIDSPSTNFGFMLRLNVESYYRAMVFASSDNADATNHPKLVINYSPIGVLENEKVLTSTFMSPTILTQESFIEIPSNETGIFTLSAIDASGKTVNLPYTISGNKISITRGEIATGFYTYILNKDNRIFSTGKFVVD